MFDITNYNGDSKFESRPDDIDKESLVLVNWGNQSFLGPLIPIYEFVLDEAKKDALKQAFEEYLNQ